MKIRLVMDGQERNAVLDDNAASRDFMKLLPLDLELRDYNATEKISDLPARLDVSGSPDGFDPAPGDIAYYAPWGNLAIFYKDFGYSKGLVRLGKIQGDLSPLSGPDTVRIKMVAR